MIKTADTTGGRRRRPKGGDVDRLALALRGHDDRESGEVGRGAGHSAEEQGGQPLLRVVRENMPRRPFIRLDTPAPITASANSASLVHWAPFSPSASSSLSLRKKNIKKRPRAYSPSTSHTGASDWRKRSRRGQASAKMAKARTIS